MGAIKGRKLGKGKKINRLKLHTAIPFLKNKNAEERKSIYREHLFSKEEVAHVEKSLKEHKAQ